MQGFRALTIFSLAALALATGCKEKERATGAPGEERARSQEVPSDADEIRIGAVAGLTGQEAAWGKSTSQGLRLAVKEINEAGGVDGKKLRLIVYDDRGLTTEAAAAATRLIIQDKAHIILGEFPSSLSLAMAPIAQSNKVPMLSPGSTNVRVTEGKDYVFRNCFIDPFQGTVMATFANKELELSKVAILRDVRNDYSVGLADAFIERFRELGGSIAIDQSYSSGDIDFKAQLTAVRSARPDAIFIPGYYTDVALIARQARELGIKVPLLGGDGWDSQALFEIGGDALDGSYFSNHYSPDNPAPKVQAYLKAYREEYRSTSDALAALSYDAVYMAADAFRRAGSTESAKVRDALAATKDFEGVTGVITIDENRNASKPAVVLAIDKGKATFATTVAP